MLPPGNVEICRAFDSKYKAEWTVRSEMGWDGFEHGTLAAPPRKAAGEERTESGAAFASSVFHALASLGSAGL